MAQKTDPKVFEANGQDWRRFKADGAQVGDIVCERRGARAVVRGLAQRLVYHSPDGFEWGYGGSGPADLALNVLALFVPEPEAWRLHQDFKADVIAKLPRDGGEIRARDVYDWILDRWAMEQRLEREREGAA